MERTAFSRARSYLSYFARAKWLALIAGAATAALYAFLVLLLALCVDLLVSRGRMPNLAQLSLTEQEKFIETWKALPPEGRLEAVGHLGLGDDSPQHPDSQRHAQWSALTSAENLPPPPARITAADLEQWSQSRTGANEPPYVLAMREHELRWRAYVWYYLQRRVGSQAANSYQPPGVMPVVPGLGEENRAPHGVLGLIIRLRHSPAGRVLAFIASFNPWMWDNAQGRNPNQSYLTGLLCLAMAGTLLAAACVVIMRLAAARTTLEAVTRLRRAVYHHALRLGDQALRGAGAPAAPLLFTRHIEAIHEALFLWLTTVSRYPAQIVLLLALALFVQPFLALAVVLFGLLIWMIGGQIVAAYRRQGRALAKFASTRIVLMAESIKLMRLVKSYLMDLYNQSRVERQLAEYAKAYSLRYRGDALARPILLLLVGLGAVTLIYLAGRIVLADELSLAGLTVLVVSVSGTYPPVKGWLDLSRHLRRGRAAAAAVFEFLDRKNERVIFSDGEFLQPMSKSIEFKEVSLSEPGDSRPLLSDINLVVRAGERIGIMGADKEAKKAFLSLIPRFVDPTDGEVRIDELNLKWVTPESLRAQIGLVSQDCLIFNDSVANNIGCGEPSITLPRIIEAAKLAHAHQFVQRLPYGYETPIGELGHSLRPGEQFRVALARAIVRDPAIFIIEEPPTNLDDDTKALLDDTFNRVLPGKTVFFLPHRISTLRHCDRIILLHNGSIEAIGNHHELVHTSSLYKHLYYLEFNAFAEQNEQRHGGDMNFEAELRTALEAAESAGKLIRADYQTLAVVPDAPADLTTQTDRNAQDVILTHLRHRFPDDAICAEEKTATLQAAPQAGARTWIVDPIDGTRGFAKKNGEFSVMIGLVVDGEIAVGVVLEPARDRVTFARRGGGCWVKKGTGAAERCRVSAVATLSDSTLVRSHSKQIAERVKRIEPRRVLETYSAGVKLALVARGEADLYINTYDNFHDWDICAGHVLVTEAGGSVTGLNGSPIAYGQPNHEQRGGLLASNGPLHDAALRRLREE